MSLERVKTWFAQRWTLNSSNIYFWFLIIIIIIIIIFIIIIIVVVVVIIIVIMIIMIMIIMIMITQEAQSPEENFFFTKNKNKDFFLKKYICRSILLITIKDRLNVWFCLTSSSISSTWPFHATLPALLRMRSRARYSRSPRVPPLLRFFLHFLQVFSSSSSSAISFNSSRLLFLLLYFPSGKSKKPATWKNQISLSGTVGTQFEEAFSCQKLLHWKTKRCWRIRPVWPFIWKLGMSTFQWYCLCYYWREFIFL